MSIFRLFPTPRIPWALTVLILLVSGCTSGPDENVLSVRIDHLRREQKGIVTLGFTQMALKKLYGVYQSRLKALRRLQGRRAVIGIAGVPAVVGLKIPSFGVAEKELRRLENHISDLRRKLEKERAVAVKLNMGKK